MKHGLSIFNQKNLIFVQHSLFSLGEEVLPAEYTLAKDESRTGLLVFEVPAGEKEFSISYMEYFEDETTGDTLFVFFNAEKK